MRIRSLMAGVLVAGATLGAGTAARAEPGDPDTLFGASGVMEIISYGVSAQIVTLDDGSWVLGSTRVEGPSRARDHVDIAVWNNTIGYSGGIVYDKRHASIELVELLAHHGRIDVVMSDILSGGGVRTLVGRLLEDGSPDPAWNDGKPISISNATRSVAVSSAVSTADGGLALFAGKRLVKLTSTGLIDQSFSGDGVAKLKLPSDDAIVTDVVRRKKGELALSIIARPDRQNYSSYVSVLHADGTVKKEFGNKGTRQVTVKGYSSVIILDIDTMPNRNFALGLAAAVEHQPDATYRSAVAVVSGGTGKLDQSFSKDGLEVLAKATTSGCCVAVQPDGRILLGGASGRSWRIVRFAANGARDKSFGNQGTVSVPFSSPDGSYMSDMAIDRVHDRVMVTGSVRDDVAGESYTSQGAFSLV